LRLTRLAPVLFVALWSSGFIGAKLGLPHAEPFTFLLIRLSLTSVILVTAAAAFGLPWPKKPSEFGHIIVVGLLVHAVYLGGVFSSIALGVPAGLAALVTGLQPLLTAALASRWLGERVIARQWFGLLLGLAGLVMVVWRTLGVEASDLLRLTPVLAALLGITVGTLYQKRFCSSMNLVTGTTVQYLATCAVFAFLAVSRETMKIEWTSSFVFALLWLALVLSVGAIFLLFYLLRHGEAAGVASLFYLTPASTAFLAWLMFDEVLPPLAVGGVALTALGVALARRPSAPVLPARSPE
jgi:drug/metabolite transporter (DMT)-like permease